MKKIIIMLLALCCIFVGTTGYAEMILEYDGVVHNYTGAICTLKVNGKILDNLPLEPVIVNERALVPVREVFEELGAKVTYNSDRSTDITYGSNTVRIQIDSTRALVNGVETTIPDNVAPKLISKRGGEAKTMVPVRFISENVGLDVDFDSSSDCIIISEKVSAVGVKLNKITYEENNGTVTVKIAANGVISGITKGAKTAAGVVYTDVSNASYTTPNKTEVKSGCVTAVRVGIHGNDTRIAVDTENMKSYNVELSADKKTVIFTITGASSSQGSAEKPVQNPSETNKPVSSGEKIVVLDAGHGGNDPGAGGSLMTDKELSAYYAALESTEPILATMQAGSGTKYYEKTIALSVAKKVKSELEANGVSVLMTRSGDTYPTLQERPDFANEKGAALFVSIHLNSTANAVTAAKGVEVYYSENNNDDDYGATSKQTAEDILKGIISATGAKSRGVKSANHLVTRESEMPANLIEIGFMNNPEELKNLVSDSYQTKMAKGIANGIISALKKIELP